MKLYIFKLENKNETFVEYNKDNFFEGFYDPYTKIIDEEAKEKLKKLGIDIDELYKKNESLEAVLEDLDEETKEEEEVEYILNDLSYLPQAYPSCYCEDIHSKEDIEELEDDLYLDNDGFICTKEDLLDWHYDTCYHYWDGHNHRCAFVEWLNEIEVEEIDDYDELMNLEKDINDYDYRKTYHYDFYRTPDNKLFRVFVSYYQGELNSIDEEFGDWKEIFKNL